MTPPPYLKFLCILSIATSFSMISCADNSKLKLEVQNSNLNFISIEQGQFSYKNVSEKENAKNILTYKLSNPTNKKLLFFFDKMHLEPGYAPVTSKNLYSGYMGFYIWSKAKTVKKYNFVLPYWAEIGEFSGCWLRELEIRNNTYEALGVDKEYIQILDNFTRNSIIVNPGETRTFKVPIYLPIIQEMDHRTQTPPTYYKLEESDKFQLFYYCNVKEITKALPKYILEELKHNEVEIFDGELRANPIKVKKK